jgi:hypothetical protein
MNTIFRVHIHIREYEYESNMAANLMFIFANMYFRESLPYASTPGCVPDEILAASRDRGAQGSCYAIARVRKVFRGS